MSSAAALPLVHAVTNMGHSPTENAENESAGRSRELNFFYARHAASQKRLIDRICERHVFGSSLDSDCSSSGQGLLERLLHARRNDNDAADCRFVVADYGAADCLNSVDVYTQIREQLSETEGSGKQLQLQVNVVDLPGNDWVRAAQSCEAAGLSSEEVQFVRRSFYQPLEELSGTGGTEKNQMGRVDLGLCSNGTHWLSQESVLKHGLRLEESFQVHHATRTQAEERARFAAASHEDGAKFLRARASEMRPGGLLLLGNSTVFGTPGDKGYDYTYRAAFEDITELLLVWRQRMAASGFAERLAGLALPVYCRSEGEWRALLAEEDTGLRLVSLESEVIDNPYWEREFGEVGKQGSAEAFADAYARSIMAFSESTFLRVFMGDVGFEYEHELFCAFLAELKAKFAKDPERYRYDHCVNRMVLQKV